ncbi:MAG: DNA-processing protein DprA [Desertimonas sp.]
MSGLTEASLRTGQLAALAGLDLVTVARLRLLLAHHDPEEAYAVALGRARPDPLVAAALRGRVGAAWRHSANRRDPETWARRCAALEVRAITPADEGFPACLRCDPDPPAVLFVRGDLGAIEHRRVGIVGTRNASRFGRETAVELGHGLATAGVAVVSGLAKGIDGAAHRGALDAHGAAPVAVVANGHDRPYPRINAALWASVAREGLVVSEWPPGTAPEAFRFPLRNRIIAGLSEVLVVVESRERGGSLITAMAAVERGVDVFAVPGSPRVRSSLGTNRLLRDGASPLTEVADVLAALGIDHRRAGGAPYDPRPVPRGVEAAVLARCRDSPCTLDAVADALDLAPGDAAMAVARLERSGWVRQAGGWFEAVGPWGGLA